MTKLTQKAFAVLVNLDVYKEAQAKAQKSVAARIITEVYAPMEARVPQPKEGRPAKGTLRMKRNARKGEPVTSIAGRVNALALEEREYLKWVEAHSTRRQIEELFAEQHSAATLKQAEQMLIQVSQDVKEAMYMATVGHNRIVKIPRIVTWVETTYPKVK